jgi:hypothetical protein
MSDDLDRPTGGLEPEAEEIRGVPDSEVIYTTPEPRKAKRGQSSWARWPLYMVMGCVGLCAVCCVFPFCLLFASGLGLAAILSNSEATQTATETVALDTENPITLYVDATLGSIHVRPGSGDQAVVVTYTKKAYGLTKSRALKELDNIAITITPPDPNTSPDVVRIEVDTNKVEDSFWSLANHVELEITVPEDLHIQIDQNVGSIDIEGVTARSLNVHSNTGSITFDGDIGVNSTETFLIETNTGSITVRLPANVDARLEAQTDTGSVSVSGGFDRLSDVSDTRTGAGARWSGLLGEGSEEPPILQLTTNTGSIDVGTR